MLSPRKSARRSSVTALASLLLLVRPVIGDVIPHHKYDDVGANLGPHPDPNEEHYEGMHYVGKVYIEEDHGEELAKRPRIGFDQDNTGNVVGLFANGDQQFLTDGRLQRCKAKLLLHVNAQQNVYPSAFANQKI